MNPQETTLKLIAKIVREERSFSVGLEFQARDLSRLAFLSFILTLVIWSVIVGAFLYGAMRYFGIG